jgi:hypothetical protein
VNREITSHSASLIEKDREPSISFHRNIGNREVDAQNLALQNSDTRYRDIPRRLLSLPSQRTGGSGSTHRRHFGIRGFKLSKKLDIATREIAIREIPIRSQPSILAGHVADIEATIGIRCFHLTDTLCQRSIASRDIPRRHQDRPSLSDAWRKSGDSEKVPKRKAPSAFRDSRDQEVARLNREIARKAHDRPSAEDAWQRSKAIGKVSKGNTPSENRRSRIRGDREL